MKRNKNKTQRKSKLALLSLAAILPMATTGIVGYAKPAAITNAVVSSSSYTKSYVEEISLSNNNFNSSSSSSALNQYPSGWSSQLKNAKTTSGVVNTGSVFQSYMSGTLYLSKNPHSNGSDNQILMINSRTSDSGNYAVARQGYKSNSVTLAENSFYSFQVAFKTDTNYETKTEYDIAGTFYDESLPDGGETPTITQDTFKSNPVKSFKLNEDGTVGKEYISFYYSTYSKTYYLLKTLTKLSEKLKTSSDFSLENVEFFYEDEFFYGFLYGSDKKPVYVKKTDATLSEDKTKITVNEDVDGYECPDLLFIPDEGSSTVGKYQVRKGKDSHFYKSKTVPNELNCDTRGSIYLNGLVDEDGNEIQAEYTSVTSKNWVTFYFFVATGNKSQTVDLELWLGSKKISSSGVVFFDDVHINRYSENAFWKTYAAYFDNGYDLMYDTNQTKHQNCTKFVDLRTPVEDLSNALNLDFEEGIYTSPTSLKGWKKDESTTGDVQVFDIKFPSKYALNQKSYDFVGSDLSCKVELEEDLTADYPRLKVKTVKENNYGLGLGTENESVKVTNESNILIESKKIYKISANYKFSELSEGNAYLFVKEEIPATDTTLSNLVERGYYKVAEEASTGGASSNASDKFSNDYGKMEFFVKGGALYDSNIKISLGLGKQDENSTGFVIFDNVKVEYASSEEYDNASSKLELGTDSSSTGPTITNGEFDSVKISKDDDGIYAPQNWTITKGSENCIYGVFSTNPKSYADYHKKYADAQESSSTIDPNNKYNWAFFPNPGNRFGDERPDNILMLGNLTNSWQRLKSENITISPDTNYRLSFSFKNNNNLGFKVSLYAENGMKLYESGMLTSSAWKEHSIYLSSFYGETKIYAQIDFGTESEGVTGALYLDNFALEQNVTSVPSDGDNVVSMKDMGKELKTNNITSDKNTSKTESYVSSSTSGENYSVGAVIKGEFDSEKSPYYFDDETGKSEEQKFFYLEVSGRGSHTITSNFNIDLKASSYYVLSFRIKTHFNYLDDFELDEEKTYNYGVTFGLTNYKYATNLVSNEEFKEYKIYINSAEAKATQLYMALICDSKETAGSAAIYDVHLDPATEEEYKEAKAATEGTNFDLNEAQLFASEAQESAPEDEETPEETPSENNGQDFNWLLIPTLITALAIVIAVVGYFLRKIKIKKIQFKKRNSYDRKTSANVDFIKRKAAEERDSQLKVLQNTKAKFEEELARLESAHKGKVVSLREKDKGSVSKETDKEFKVFAKKRTVIAEKLDILNKQIEETNSPEHLLSLERKIFAEQESIKRNLEKSSKKAEKAKAKKQNDKTNK